MKLKELKPNPKNPRKIADHKLQMLEHSVKEFGSLDGIIYNRRTKRLVGGHQRQKLDQDAEVVIETQNEDEAYGYVLIDGKRFPYREVDWDEKKELAANVAANKGAGEWDLPILSDLLIELDDGQFDMDLTMFDNEEREKIIVPEVEVLEPGCDEDESPPVPKIAKTKLGDIYLLGGKYVCDCGEVHEVG